MTPSAQVILTEMKDGTGVLLEMSTKFYYTLNATGVFVWKAAESTPGLNLDELANRVHETFEVDLDTAAADIRLLVADLVKERLLSCDELG